MAASAVGKPTYRNVHEISLSRETIMGEEVLTIKVVGNAFLHSMVRTIVGTHGYGGPRLCASPNG